MPEKVHTEAMVRALKAAGIVIPLDLNLPEKVIQELSKSGVDITPDTAGGFCLNHYVFIWRN